MKRTLALLVIAALGLTACTDQPVPAPPNPTTATSASTDTLASEDQVAQHIANVLEHPAPEQFPVDDAALAAFSDTVIGDTRDTNADDDDQSCPPLTAQPEVAVFGSAPPVDEATSEDAEEETSALAAFGFDSTEEAEDFTEQLLSVVSRCDIAHYEAEQLTHHTEAVEITIEFSAEQTSSIVLLRNQHWVLAATSSPPADVALSLTLVDQLDEMLR